ncbi:hypothetical protein D3C76_1725750 [compost metagenome]
MGTQATAYGAQARQLLGALAQGFTGIQIGNRRVLGGQRVTQTLLQVEIHQDPQGDRTGLDVGDFAAGVWQVPQAITAAVGLLQVGQGLL